MKLKISQFCGLSKHDAWKRWLKNIAPDLFDKLVEIHKKHKGCKTNREVMVIIKRDLYQRGLGDTFEEFIRTRFPFIIDKNYKTTYNANKHKIFESYNPRILTFPHRYIIIDKNEIILNRKIQEFIKDKVGVDFIIIEDRAYIEYFEKRFEGQVALIEPEARPINVYRQKNHNNRKI